MTTPRRAARTPLLERLVPLVGFVRRSDRASLRTDAVAGLTVAVMLVPQSMAYASLAGLPPVAGLYAAIVPVVVYALLGTSGALAVGPVAITALLTSTALAPLAAGDPWRYAALAGLLALMVGALQLLLGALRLGVLVSFLSHSVLSGFTSAAALVIAASQLKDLLGLRIPRAEDFVGIVTSVAGALGTTQGLTALVGLGSVAALLVLRRFVPRLPGPLLVVVVATAVSALAGLGERGVRILETVPAGLPAPVVPPLAVADLTALAPSAAAIALVAYMEGIAVAKALAAKAGQRVDPNQELIAVGAANAAAGVFQAFPVAGGFSRSAVSFQAGARTPVASLVAALVVAVTALVLTPLFFHLPSAVLAAVVVVAVLGLVDRASAVSAWRTRRSDGVAVLLTFAATLALGVEPGLAAGVVFSLAVFLWRSARPHTAELGRVPGSAVYRNTARYEVLTDAAVLLLRVDGPLYFANAERLTDQVTGIVEDRPDLRAVVLDASAVSDTDTDGAHALDALRERLADRGVALHLATVRGPVRDLLARAEVWPAFTAVGAVHRDVAAAVEVVDPGGHSPLRSPAEPARTDLSGVL
ncbi:SulP family inorganic anion transporter [Actinomycetospora lemnae]|uniref:Sulfate permease n=1 Tax=Actinomycetospora lemnae TaxID=3019891 RepID=A0ABT5SRZ9_9PSEU|nr:sulfate permease [Actinomycetospora sp. DW7H6]MDD7965622.1 sulfate permease [Actinomycetospora sp. DW7H6]